tara:strand:- start:210 stop:356 length:147 start_codon:yes stop_codon:yes gene_type:complete
MKKGSLTWDTIGKLILAVAFLLLFLVLLYMSSDKFSAVGDKIKDVLGV